jgi:hypothetical protein
MLQHVLHVNSDMGVHRAALGRLLDAQHAVSGASRNSSEENRHVTILC